ncbi:MAG: DNA-binding protein [Ruminococcus sp.]|nr:DNA-binding protein [Ruminococcus sp.]MCM1380727.1 excisionase [Muribaculaceae bacterium]MCM1479145.1 excisionase [Muribaculaceae bacterium]
MEEKTGLNISIGEKYLLTIKEAGAYFNIGQKKMRRLAEDNLGLFSIYSGNRYLVIRPKFEEYICQTSTI